MAGVNGTTEASTRRIGISEGDEAFGRLGVGRVAKAVCLELVQTLLKTSSLLQLLRLADQSQGSSIGLLQASRLSQGRHCRPASIRRHCAQLTFPYQSSRDGQSRSIVPARERHTRELSTLLCCLTTCRQRGQQTINRARTNQRRNAAAGGAVRLSQSVPDH